MPNWNFLGLEYIDERDARDPEDEQYLDEWEDEDEWDDEEDEWD